MKLRIVIADDEPLSRERLRRLLETEPGLEVVAECGNGPETVHAIQRRQPHLVFLDVTMPELDGFGVLASLPDSDRPAIIFVTAHPGFAVRAFGEEAVDYLLKPVGRERLQTALRRARAQLEQDRRANLPAVQRPPTLERLAVPSRERIAIVETRAIDWIEAADNYVELHVGRESHLLRMALGALADRLPPDLFIRISRSILVNAERIQEIRPKSHGDYRISLRDGTDLTGSRNYRVNLARWLDRSQ